MDTGVAIIGAGPYGLAAAAHLRRLGQEVTVFGRVMGAWEQMPTGMLLRSFREATSIGDPDGRLTIDAFEQARGREIPTPVPVSDFIEYGHWFREQTPVEVDPRLVRLVDHDGRSFKVTLADGEEATAGRVVVAAGIAPFVYVPPELQTVDHGRITHSSAHSDFSAFRGRRVVVVGAGQSGLEWGVLAHDAGASVEVVSRRPLRFLRGERVHDRSGLMRPLLYPRFGVGPPGINWLMGYPGAYRLLPGETARSLAYRSIRPAGAGWLRPRLAPIRITTGASVRALREEAGELHVELDDGSERRADHLIAATGYRIDIARYPFLAPRLLDRIERVGGFPRLSTAYESSAAGLHFVGAPAAASMGPGMRFVSHSGMAAAAVARRARRR